jgi:hypothetical protein
MTMKIIFALMALVMVPTLAMADEITGIFQMKIVGDKVVVLDFVTGVIWRRETLIGDGNLVPMTYLRRDMTNNFFPEPCVAWLYDPEQFQGKPPACPE